MLDSQIVYSFSLLQITSTSSHFTFK